MNSKRRDLRKIQAHILSLLGDEWKFNQEACGGDYTLFWNWSDEASSDEISVIISIQDAKLKMNFCMSILM